MELQRRAGLEDDGMESSGTSCGPDMFRDRSQGASGAPPIGASVAEDVFEQFIGETIQSGGSRILALQFRGMRRPREQHPASRFLSGNALASYLSPTTVPLALRVSGINERGEQTREWRGARSR